MAVKKDKRKTVKKAVAGKKTAKKKITSKKKPSVKKTSVKKAKKPVNKPRRKKADIGVLVGAINHYFPKVRAAVIKLKVPLSVGDTIRIKGHTSDFTESVNSIQIDRVPIDSAKKGQEIGLLVNSRVRQHDLVYKV
jgi:hypothetical protein